MRGPSISELDRPTAAFQRGDSLAGLLDLRVGDIVRKGATAEAPSRVWQRAMKDQPAASWDNALELLKKWHQARRPEIGRSVLQFLEVELRLMTPALVRRSWPEDLVEDALRDLLERLVARPLTNDITDLRTYLQRAFRNHCIDSHRARQRKRETSLESTTGEWEHLEPLANSPLQELLRDERRAQVHAALPRLSQADRIVLKLEFAPEWLDDAEVASLAERTALTPSEVRQAIDAARDTHALTRIFDPGPDDPNDSELRRTRMERFRRRRTRAMEKLRDLLHGDGS